MRWSIWKSIACYWNALVLCYYIRGRTIQPTMPQDANARLNAKRKATLKIAKQKAAAAGEPTKASARKGAAKKAAK